MGLRELSRNIPTQKPIGAEQKIATAAKVKKMERAYLDGESVYQGQHYDQTIPFTIGFVMSVILALISLETDLIDLSGYALTGVAMIDDFIFGNDIYEFFGQADIDKVFTLFVRGFSYCMIAAIVSALGKSIVALGDRGKVDPFTACWCALLSLPLLYLAHVEWLLPSLYQVFNGF